MSEPTPQLMEIARAASDAAPIDASAMFKQLIEAIRGPKHWELLEGCVPLNWQDVLEARWTYARALGRSVEALTAAEKQTAYLNHVMEKLA